MESKTLAKKKTDPASASVGGASLSISVAKQEAFNIRRAKGHIVYHAF